MNIRERKEIRTQCAGFCKEAGDGKNFAVAVLTTNAFILCTPILDFKQNGSATKYCFLIVCDCEYRRCWPYRNLNAVAWGLGLSSYSTIV